MVYRVINIFIDIVFIKFRYLCELLSMWPISFDYGINDVGTILSVYYFHYLYKFRPPPCLQRYQYVFDY